MALLFWAAYLCLRGNMYYWLLRLVYFLHRHLWLLDYILRSIETQIALFVLTKKKFQTKTTRKCRNLWLTTANLTAHLLVVNQTFKDRSTWRYYSASLYLIRRTSSAVSHQIIRLRILGIYGWRGCCECPKKNRTIALSILNIIVYRNERFTAPRYLFDHSIATDELVIT